MSAPVVPYGYKVSKPRSSDWILESETYGTVCQVSPKGLVDFPEDPHVVPVDAFLAVFHAAKTGERPPHAYDGQLADWQLAAIRSGWAPPPGWRPPEGPPEEDER